MSKREFELDLTSVCVGSGVVQLPLKMQAIFDAGTILARVDGEDVLLTFSEPRRLSGFKEHFERRGLRGNDKLRFEVDVTADKAVALVAASIKRERKQPTAKGAATVAADGSAVGSGAERAPLPTPSSSWGDNRDGGQVRAVRRVRIEGGMPLPVSPATQRFNHQPRGVGMGLTEARAGSNGSTSYGGWAPLDGLSADAEQHQPVTNDYPESTVREVRRSQVADDRRQEQQDAGLEGAWVAAGTEQAVPPLYSHGFEVVDQGAATANISGQPPAPTTSSNGARGRTVGYGEAAVPETAEQVANEPAAVTVEARGSKPTTAPLQHKATAGETASQPAPVAVSLAAPRIPVPRNTAAGSTWQPTPASGLNLAEPAESSRRPLLIEESDLAPRHEASHQTGRPLETRRDASPRVSQERLIQEPTAPATMAPRAIDDAEFGGEYLPSGRSLEAATMNKAEVAGRDARTTPVGSVGAGIDQVRSDPRPDTGVAPVQMQPAKPIRLEDDLRMIEAYLDRPDIPAIVRSEVIAADLGIDDQRSERALERLSENRDRVSRIRKGAYMVKRSAMGHSTGLR